LFPSSSPAPPTTSAPRRSAAAVLLVLLVLLLTLAACGSSPSAGTGAGASTSTAAAGQWPVTVTGDNGQVVIDRQPEAIVSMSATATEMLYAIGAGPEVKAVDSTSNYPADAPITDLSAFTPNAEAIAAYQPDLVVLSDDQNGIVDALGALKVPTLLLGGAKTLEDSYGQLTTLGDATGHADGATAVVADVQHRVQAAVASVPPSTRGMRVYHELDPTYYSADSSTFIGSVYTLFGLDNVADGAAGASGGYPQLSAEYLVTKAPDVIVLADTVCCGQSAETLAQRPAFDTVPAVQQGRVLAVDDDIASRWGPRVADFAESVATVLRK
jgi:iron complex transport system substrate-binding protein